MYLLFTFFVGCAVGWCTRFKALKSFQPFVFHTSGRRGRHFTFAVGVRGTLDFGSKEFFLQRNKIETCLYSKKGNNVKHLNFGNGESQIAESVNLTEVPMMCGGRDGSVGIATRYGLDGLGIESRCEARFSAPVQLALGPTQPPVKWVPGLSKGVKRPGRGADPPHHPSSVPRS